MGEGQRWNRPTSKSPHDDRSDAQEHDGYCQGERDAPHGSRDDRAVEGHDLTTDHVDPFDVLASDDVDCCVTEEGSGESESEKRPGRPTESGESTT